MPLSAGLKSVADIAIGIGSNLGDRAGNIHQAANALDATAGIGVSKMAPLYETEPWGNTDQPEFLNTCLKAQTTLSPLEVLSACLGIEEAMGRERVEKWGPRIIDLDVLVYGDQTIEQPGLTVPHPHIADRAFVLLPLADIWPNARIDGRAISELAERYAASTEIWRYEPEDAKTM